MRVLTTLFVASRGQTSRSNRSDRAWPNQPDFSFGTGRVLAWIVSTPIKIAAKSFETQSA